MIRCLVRAWLTILGHHLDRRVCQWPNQTSEDEYEWQYDNRERAHAESGCWCLSPNESGRKP